MKDILKRGFETGVSNRAQVSRPLANIVPTLLKKTRRIPTRSGAYSSPCAFSARCYERHIESKHSRTPLSVP